MTHSYQLGGKVVHGERMRVLSVISSSNQLYSGIGRNLFELADRMSKEIAFEFAIDDATPRNVEIASTFAQAHDIPLHLAPAVRKPFALDTSGDGLQSLVRQPRFDVVECLCWANAATNSEVLSAIDDSKVLVYTPHDQPLWTVPMSEASQAVTSDCHSRMVRRADLVLCDSPAEKAELQLLAPGRFNCAYQPIGCDFEYFQFAKTPRKPQLLFVGDLAEPRKRFDRVLAVFEELLQLEPALRLVVIGSPGRVATAKLPESVRHAVTIEGYVDETSLLRAYQESLGFLLFSEYEAFGIPILESLACGTPVFLTPMETTIGLFQPFAGVHFCPPDEAAVTAQLIYNVITRYALLSVHMKADRPSLCAQFDWRAVADNKWALLRSAWFRKKGLRIPA
jgi:glycosyltransferase involved in cell wall biosynthesis